MTDPTDPIDPADRAWFRSHVDPVLEDEPVPEAWDELAARVRGGSSAPPSAAPSHARWIAAAAVLVALALAGLAVMATQGADDESDTLRAGGDHPAGWYIPTGLPAGWQLQSAMATEAPPCDGASRRWKTRPEHAEDDGSRPAIELRFSSCGRLPDDPGVAGPAVGPDATPSFVDPSAEDPSWEVVRWEDDGLWELTGEGISGSRLLEAADAVASNPAAAAPPLPELTVTGAGSGQEPRPGGKPGAAIVVVSPTGQQLQYELVASGEGPQLTPFTNEVAHPVTDQPLPLRRRGSIEVDRLREVGGMGTGYLYGTWPGADVLVPEHVGPKPGTDRPPTAAEAQAATDALAGSLRRASTDEWRAFLATAAEPVTDQQLLTATSLATIGADPATTPSASEPEQAPTTTSAPSFTQGDGRTPIATDPGGDGPVVSDPGVSRPRERPSKMFSSLDGLEFRFELESDTIRAGQPVPGTLVIGNTTDRELVLNECTVGLIQWGLVPADEPEADPPPRDIIDCYDDPIVAVPANGEARRALDPFGGGFRAQRAERAFWPLGTLPGGAYLAVVEVPGDETTVRATIEVQVPEPPCPTSDALAKRYLDLTSDQAADRAVANGLAYRAVRIDGEPQLVADDLRCDRINVDLSNDRVTNVLRY